MNSNDSKPSVLSVVILLLLLVVANGLFLVSAKNCSPDPKVTSICFLNVAILCQIIPMFLNRQKYETSQIGGCKVLSGIYLGIEILALVLILNNDAEAFTAFWIQLVVCLLYFVSLLWTLQSSNKSNKSLQAQRDSKVEGLKFAVFQLRNAYAACPQPEGRQVLSRAIAKINMTPMTAHPLTNEIDQRIIEATAELCMHPDTHRYAAFETALTQRKILLQQMPV